MEVENPTGPAAAAAAAPTRVAGPLLYTYHVPGQAADGQNPEEQAAAVAGASPPAAAAAPPAAVNSPVTPQGAAGAVQGHQAYPYSWRQPMASGQPTETRQGRCARMDYAGDLSNVPALAI